MMHELLSDYFSQRLISAVAYSIFASLKYMTLAALALKILLSILPRQKAEWRYYSSLICLAIGFGFSVSAFGAAWFESPTGSANHSAGSTAENLQVFFFDIIYLKISSLLTEAETFVLHRADLLTGFWLAGFLFSAFRFSFSYFFLQKIKTQGLEPVGPEWEAVKNRLTEAAGLQRKVGLYLSDRIRSPMTLGHFKPLILIPVGMFAGLSAAQTEAVLMHELAHIKRNDYLINLLQSAVELLLFYHPAVHYISKCIRDERENCCDDAAVSICGDPPAYARALLRLEADFLTAGGPALGFAGHRYSDRFRRLKRLAASYKFDFNQLTINIIPQKKAGQGQLSRRVFRLFGNGRPQASRQLIWFFPLLLFSCLLLFDTAESAPQKEPAVFGETVIHREILLPADRSTEEPRRVVDFLDQISKRALEKVEKTTKPGEISVAEHLVWKTEEGRNELLILTEDVNEHIDIHADFDVDFNVDEHIDIHANTAVREEVKLTFVQEENRAKTRTFSYRIKTIRDSAGKAPKKRFLIDKSGNGSLSSGENIFIEKQTKIHTVFAPEEKTVRSEPVFIINGQRVSAAEAHAVNPDLIKTVKVIKGKKALALFGEKGIQGVVELSVGPEKKESGIFIGEKKRNIRRGILLKKETKDDKTPEIRDDLKD